MNNDKYYNINFIMLREEYNKLLINFLKSETISEEYLTQAYQLGRQAIQNKHSILSITTIHHDCLIDFLEELEDDNHISLVEKADILLEEILTPFAMTIQESFREAVKLLNERSIEFALRIRGLKEEIHRRKKSEKESERIKNEFLANMSHELRTPLNAIIGFTDLMYSGQAGDISADSKEYLGDILSSGRHLLQLINEILDLAKVDGGKIEFQPEVINLNTLISEVSESMGALFSKKQLTLNIKQDPSLKHVIIDPNKFRQILYNYLSNAIKFSEDGEINIVTEVQPNGFFKLKVIDNGVGIGEDQFDQLFTPFHQLDISPSKQYQGTGLGLALTRSIVEAQGGTVGVNSTLGKGSTFYAILPRAPIRQPVDLEKKMEDSTEISTEIFKNSNETDQSNVQTHFAKESLSKDEITQSQLSAIVESTSDAIISVDLDTTIISWNRGAEKLYGYTEQEAIGKSLIILFPESRLNELIYEVEEIKKGNSVNYFETERKHKSGELIPVLATISPIENKKTKFKGFCSITRDMREWKKHEKTILSQQEAIQKLSIPILQLNDNLLLLPLLGNIDEARAIEITTKLLNVIRKKRAKVTIIDITGVPHVNNGVAHLILKTATATQLMGAKVILTGLSSSVAESLSLIQIDYNKIMVEGDLRAGMEVANQIIKGTKVSINS